MKYYQTVTLKNRKTCIIRHAEAADAAEVRRSFLQTHAETDNLLTYPDDSRERGGLSAKDGGQRKCN